MRKFASVTYRSWQEAIRQLAAIVNEIIQSLESVITVTSDYTAAEYRIILVDCTSNPVTVTLPSASDYDGTYKVKKIDSTSNAVTVDGDGSETIDGMTTITWSAQYDCYQLASNGTGWSIV